MKEHMYSHKNYKNILKKKTYNNRHHHKKILNNNNNSLNRICRNMRVLIQVKGIQ